MFSKGPLYKLIFELFEILRISTTAIHSPDRIDTNLPNF